VFGHRIHASELASKPAELLPFKTGVNTQKAAKGGKHNTARLLLEQSSRPGLLDLAVRR
jgi:hypothetical protein